MKLNLIAADGNVALQRALIEILEKMYRQSNEAIEDQRGAIVERLGYELVSPRYQQYDKRLRP